jgi:hypothetical protein
MKFIKKNISFIALIIVIIGAAAYYMTKDGGNTAVVTEGEVPSSGAEATFLGFSSELESVTFDPAIFTDPRFVSLQDIRTNIVDEGKGRRDPFAPLAGVVVTP